MGLPDTVELEGSGLPVYQVHGKTFAALTPDGLVQLQLDEATVRSALGGCTITEARIPGSESAAVAVPLADVNAMELNNLVYRSWLSRAPGGLAEAAQAANRGQAPQGPDALPAAIGKPASRALLLANINSLQAVAAMTQEELLSLHGVGPKAVRLLAEALAASGRTFARNGKGPK